MELQDAEKNVTTLVKRLRVPQSTVSHHLALLRMSSLVKARRNGKQIYYSLNGGQIQAAKALRSALRGSTGLKIGKLAFGLAD
jgi:DNA-binding transcriptional ArsR family regulator